MGKRSHEGKLSHKYLINTRHEKSNESSKAHDIILPVEMMMAIAPYLSCSTLLALRMTCKSYYSHFYDGTPLGIWLENLMINHDAYKRYLHDYWIAHVLFGMEAFVHSKVRDQCLSITGNLIRYRKSLGIQDGDYQVKLTKGLPITKPDLYCHCAFKNCFGKVCIPTCYLEERNDISRATLRFPEALSGCCDARKSWNKCYQEFNDANDGSGGGCDCDGGGGGGCDCDTLCTKDNKRCATGSWCYMCLDDVVMCKDCSLESYPGNDCRCADGMYYAY